MSNPFPSRKGRQWIKWLLIAVGVIAVAILAIDAASTFSQYQKAGEAWKSRRNNDKASSAPASPGDVRADKYPTRLPIADVTGDQFIGKDTAYPYKYTRQEQLDYSGAKLNANTQATVTRMRDRVAGTQNTTFFTDESGVSVRVIAQPSLSNTPQQIWDQITVGSFQAWEVAQNGNIEEAKKLAAAVDDPGHREFTDEINGFSNTDAAGTNSNGVVWNAKPIIASGDYEGIPAAPNAPLIEFNVNIGGNDTGNRIKAVLRFEQGSGPDASRWVLVTTYDA